MNINIRIDGVNQLMQNINTKLQQAKEAAKQGATEVALDLSGRAKQLAPIDIGDLRGSGYTRIEDSGNRINAEIGFSEPYALVQHETLWFDHPRGGQAKYLQQPMQENADRYVEHIINTVKGVID